MNSNFFAFKIPRTVALYFDTIATAFPRDCQNEEHRILHTATKRATSAAVHYKPLEV